MSWNLEGMRVWGTYLETFPVVGRVELSRVKYGGGISHHILLEEPIEIFGATRDRVILDHAKIERVAE